MGVDALGVGLVVDEDKDALLVVVVVVVGVGVGVEDLGVALDVGVEDLGGAVGLEEDKTGRELVGVEDLEGLEVGFEVVVVLGGGFDVVVLDDAPKAGLLVGVEGLEPEPPEEVGLRGPALGAGDAARGLDTMLFLLGGASGWVFDSLDFDAFGWGLGVPFWCITVFCDCDSDSSEGKRGVPGGVRSHS